MKAHTVIKLLFISLLFFSVSCKKKSRELTTVNFHLYNPVSNEPYAGVKVSVLQEKNTSKGFNSSGETETIWQGETDASGKASYSFKAYNNQQYFYWQDAENSFVQNPSLELLEQPAFLPLNKNEVNEVVYKTVKNMSSITWIKNMNCFNENDRMRYRRRNIADIFDDWSPWIPLSTGTDNYYYGCYDVFPNAHTHRKYGILRWKLLKMVLLLLFEIPSI